MKASVVLAAFNGADFIGEQLESIAAQTVVPDELIVLDDRSTDSTPEVVESFIKDSPLKVFYSVNSSRLGCTRNFLKGIALASGDLIFLSDQDDYWLPNKIERFLCAAESNPESLVFTCDCFVTDRALNGKKTKLSIMRSCGFSESHFIAGSCSAIRKRYSDFMLPGTGEILSHDDFLVGLSILARKRYFIAEPLQYFRRHEGNVSDGIAKSPGGGNVLSKVAYFFRRFIDLSTLDMDAKIRSEQIKLNKAVLIAKSEPKMGNIRNSEIEDMKENIVFLENRKNILSKRRILRIIPILILLTSGFYNEKIGVFVAIKDCIRPVS